MKFKKGDKVRAVKNYSSWYKLGDTFEIHRTDDLYVIINHPTMGVGGFLPSDFELALTEPAVPVFDRYFVYSGGTLVANYSTFDEADTRARGLAECGKIATVKGVTTDKLIATYQRPVPPVEVIFADQT